MTWDGNDPTLPRRAGRACLLTALLSGHLATAAATPVTPTIDAETFSAGPGQLGFQFTAAQGAPSDFEILTAQDPAGSWNRASAEDATVDALGPDRYQVRLLLHQAPDRQFVRIRRLGLPPLPLAPVINEVMSDNATSTLPGGNEPSDWVELFNPHDEAVDLEGLGIAEASAASSPWKFPAVRLQPGAYLLLFASGLDRAVVGEALHTDFRLRASGETLVLVDSFGRELDRVVVPSLLPDQSIGRAPDGADTWQLYHRADATPAAENRAVSGPEVIEPPAFSIEGGFQAGPIELVLTARRPEWFVHYTTNGAPATLDAPSAGLPIQLERTTVIRALAADPEGHTSEEVGHTYLFGPRPTLPVVCLAAPAEYFEFDDGYLYGLGSAVLSPDGRVLQNYPFSGSNAWQDREIQVRLEFYEPDGAPGLRQRAGLKVFGGWGSRGYPQKSFALFARRQYGAGKFRYAVFPDSPVDSFESLVLRNSGNDNQSTHQTPPRPPITAFGPTQSYGSYFVNGTFTLMRDGLMQRLLEGTDLDRQAYRPAVLYVNGDYWGLYNLREKLTEHHVAAHHGLDTGDLDLIEGYGDVRAGDAAAYRAMRDFVNTRNLAIESNYRYLADNYLEIDNFIDYHLAVIYFQNFDIGNIKCWRPRLPQGRFRWMVFDQDYGFGLWPAEVYEPAMARDYADYRNMFRFATAGSGTSTGWPNAGGRTLLLRRLLANPGFRDRFIRRCCDLLNGHFREERVALAIDQLAAAIRPEIPAHLARWSWSRLTARGFGPPHQPESVPFTESTWESHLQVLHRFARERPTALRADCAAHFQLSQGLGAVELRIDPPSAGQIRVNTLIPEAYPWSGTYFADLACDFVPIARPGYEFHHWSVGSTDSTHALLRWSVIPETTTTLVAHFQPQPEAEPPTRQVWIHEINYHSPEHQDAEDWVELYHPGDQPLDLTGWAFRDASDDRAFVLPSLEIAPRGYVVLCRDVIRFQVAHPGTAACVGEFPFGLGNEGDTLRLFDPRGTLVDQVTYDDDAPWPPEADGRGATLELTHPDLDHGSPQAWSASAVPGGTPGR